MKKAYTNLQKGGKGKALSAGRGKGNGNMVGKRASSGKMPLCNYGSACTRRDCVYRHPEGAARRGGKNKVVCRAFLAGICAYGRKCNDRHPGVAECEELRRQYSATACRWGEECATDGCLFRHPWDIDSVVPDSIAQQMQAALLLNDDDDDDDLVAAAAASALDLNSNALAEQYMIWQQDCCSLQQQQQQQQQQQPAPQPQPQPQPGLNFAASEWAPLPPPTAAATATAATEPFPPRTVAGGGWAAVAAAAANLPDAGANAGSLLSRSAAPQPPRSVAMPRELWLSDVQRSDNVFEMPPMERYETVNRPHRERGTAIPPTLPSSKSVGVVDLHFQSVKTAATVLDRVLESEMRRYDEVWIITGTGHHTDQRSHQRTARGGVLAAAVLDYLQQAGYDYRIGKDKRGHSGAILLTQS